MRPVLRIACLAMALATAGACNSPTKPAGSPNTLGAQLLAVSVVPPVLDAEAQAAGLATMTLQLTRDSSGIITTAAIDFQVTLSNVPTGTVLTEAHIHLGDPGVPGGIIVDTGLIQGEVLLSAGSGAFNRQGIVIPTNVAQELLATPTSFYFDVHSVSNPSGMVRGQLSR